MPIDGYGENKIGEVGPVISLMHDDLAKLAVGLGAVSAGASLSRMTVIDTLSLLRGHLNELITLCKDVSWSVSGSRLVEAMPAGERCEMMIEYDAENMRCRASVAFWLSSGNVMSEHLVGIRDAIEYATG